MGAYLQTDAALIAKNRDYVFSIFPRLKERLKQAAGTLSGGEQQMLAIGRALMGSPKFLMLDEPSLGIAPRLISTIFEKIVEINQNHGITILLVEQNANLALEVSSHAYVLETGRIVMQGPSAKLPPNPKQNALPPRAGPVRGLRKNPPQDIKKRRGILPNFPKSPKTANPNQKINQGESKPPPPPLKNTHLGGFGRNPCLFFRPPFTPNLVSNHVHRHAAKIRVPSRDQAAARYRHPLALHGEGNLRPRAGLQRLRRPRKAPPHPAHREGNLRRQARPRDQRHHRRQGEDHHDPGLRHRHDARRARRKPRHHRPLRLEGLPQGPRRGRPENASLIGQFGVGFYSAFMVAKSVKVYSHSWRAGEPGHVWTSDGAGSYEIEESEGQRRGTKIVIELKDDCADFAQDWKVKEILERYSAFVSFPINLNGKRINTVQALWLRTKNEIKDEEYTEFYKFQAHAFDEPAPAPAFQRRRPARHQRPALRPEGKHREARLRAHRAVRRALLPQGPDRRQAERTCCPSGCASSRASSIARTSRSTSRARRCRTRRSSRKLNKVITKRFLKFLDEEAKNRPDAYAEFYAEFGIFLKEGAALDFTHKDQLVKLLRFESSLTEKGKTTSLADYVSRMGSDQKEIYYLIGPNRAAIESGPYLEGFKARNLEVLFCYEAVDEYVMNNVREFDGKKLTAADHADVKLSDLPKPEGALSEDDTKTLTTWLKERSATASPR